MKVDTILKNAHFFNTFTRIWEQNDIALLQDRILFIGDMEQAELKAETVIDCSSFTLIPGLIDIHLHIESSLCTPLEFARSVLPLGITTVVTEPHEIANVFGAEGIRAMIEASTGSKLDIFYGLPSSVPSTHRELETTGGEIGVPELTQLLSEHSSMICLGEVMNYGELISEFESLIAGTQGNKTLDLIHTMQQHHPLAAIEGHCPSVRELDLAKLLYLGIDSDHCLQDLEGMKQRFARGMFVEIQEKSVTREIIDYLNSHPVEGLYSFVTDDVPPDILNRYGHLDHVVRKAMDLGLSLEKAIMASSHAPAARMGFRDRGIIAPGKLADLILLEKESKHLAVHTVFKRGREVKDLIETPPAHAFDSQFYSSIRMPEKLDIRHAFTINAPPERTDVRCRVMKKHPEDTYTKEVMRTLHVDNGEADWQSAGLNLVSVICRYGTDSSALGLLEGEQLHHGALCSSYAHDHHNLLTIGDNTEDMITAFYRIHEIQGGICVVSGGNIIAEVPLPVGGILSDLKLPELTEQVDTLQKALHTLGINHHNPIMSLCTITLPVSPDIKITDKGLIQTKTASIVDLFT
jgi:adenine deaminase